MAKTKVVEGPYAAESLGAWVIERQLLFDGLVGFQRLCRGNKWRRLMRSYSSRLAWRTKREAQAALRKLKEQKRG